MPAQAGIQAREGMDTGFRRYDETFVPSRGLDPYLQMDFRRSTQSSQREEKRSFEKFQPISLFSDFASVPSVPSAVNILSQETRTNQKQKIVEAENEQTLDAPVGDTQPALPPVQTPAAIAMRRALTGLLRKRLKKFVTLTPEIHANADAKTIHDARVCSRRLQQAIDALFPKPRSAKARRLRRTPRRVRRALGEWRNCDVLLDIVARQHRRTRSEAKRQAWAFVRDYLLQKRAKEVTRAWKRLRRAELGDYAARAQRVLRKPAGESADILLQRLSDSVQEAALAWQARLGQARESRAAADLHGLRIATKVLRYRSELLYDVGAKHLKPQLKWLAALQEVLGVWHDHQVLHQAVAEALARAEILLNQMSAVRILLAEVEKDRILQAKEVEKIFLLAMEHAGNHQMESSSEIHPTPKAFAVTESVSDKT